MTHREWNNIDLLIEIKQLQLVGVIENKAGAKASEDQLSRYRTIVETRFSADRRLFVFLAPDVHAPGEEAYVAMSYADLSRMIEGLARERIAGTKTTLILRHYVEMLRKHIVYDKQLQDFARIIYELHK